MASAVAPARAGGRRRPWRSSTTIARGQRQDERQRGERQTIDPGQPHGPRRRAGVGRDGRFEQRRAVRAGDDEAVRVRRAIAERSLEGHRAVGRFDDVGLALAAGVRRRQTRFRRHRPEAARVRVRFGDRLDGHEPQAERGVRDEQVGAVEHAIAAAAPRAARPTPAAARWRRRSSGPVRPRPDRAACRWPRTGGAATRARHASRPARPAAAPASRPCAADR